MVSMIIDKDLNIIQITIVNKIATPIKSPKKKTTIVKNNASQKTLFLLFNISTISDVLSKAYNPQLLKLSDIKVHKKSCRMQLQ